MLSRSPALLSNSTQLPSRSSVSGSKPAALMRAHDSPSTSAPAVAAHSVHGTSQHQQPLVAGQQARRGGGKFQGRRFQQLRPNGVPSLHAREAPFLRRGRRARPRPRGSRVSRPRHCTARPCTPASRCRSCGQRARPWALTAARLCNRGWRARRRLPGLRSPAIGPVIQTLLTTRSAPCVSARRRVRAASDRSRCRRKRYSGVTSPVTYSPEKHDVSNSLILALSC